ncbi:MAG: XrtA system polysaccharide chain length determinant [Acetobacteraceae bacterium]
MDDVVALLHRYAVGAWRRRWLALLAAWVICLIGWAAVMRLPPRYEASAEIHVAADPVLTPLLHGIAIGGDVSSEVDLLQRTLLSRPNLETLISKADLLPGPDTLAGREALVKKLSETIQITPQSDSLFTIAYSNSDPQRAYNIVQTMLSIFIERANGSNQSDLANAQHFLDSQLAYYRTKLQDTEKQRAAFLAKYIQLLPGAEGNVSQLDAASAKVRSLEGQLEDAKAHKAMLETELEKTPPMLVSSRSVAAGGATTDAALAAAEQHLTELRLRFTEAYPGVIAAERLVKALAAESAGKGPGGYSAPERSVPNPVYDQLKLQLIDAETALFSLTRELKSATAERDRLAALARTQPGLQAEFINVDRNYDVLRQQYQELLLRKESMQITTAANIDANRVQLQIVNPPQLPKIPVAPPRMLLLAAVLVVGLGGGAGLALLLAHADSCCYTLHDLRAVGLPVAGAISFRPAQQERRRLLPAVAFTFGVVMLGVAFAGILAGVHHLVGLA